MPRNGSNVYSKPAGTTAVSGETVSSAKFNEVVDDLAVDANTPRPIVAGGTGSSSAATARAALGLETGVDVIAYDDDIWALRQITETARLQAIGSIPPIIGNTSVEDETIVPGRYHYDTTSSGGPAGVTFGSLIHYRRAAAGGETQILYPDVPTGLQGRVYSRSRSSAGWSAWTYALNDTDLLDEDSFASNSATKAPTQQSTKAYIDNLVGNVVTEMYSGVEHAIATGTETTIAHGLSATPVGLALHIKCVVGNLGYSAGEVLACPTPYFSGKIRNASISADATNIIIRVADGIEVLRTSVPGSVQTITPSSWRFMPTAWL